MNNIKYNEKGNMIYHKYFGEYEEWYEYDENGNCIHFKSSEGNIKSV